MFLSEKFLGVKIFYDIVNHKDTYLIFENGEPIYFDSKEKLKEYIRSKKLKQQIMDDQNIK